MYFTRTLRIIGMMLRFFLEFYFVLRRLPETGRAAQAKRNRLYRSQAIRFCNLAASLGGLPIKVGQFLSTRVDVLPKAYTTELAKLQDRVPAAPFVAVREVIEGDLGTLDTVFTHLNPEPIGAASLAQVYEGILSDGTTVAVKVLRPHIEKEVRADLKALKLVITYLARYSSHREHVDFGALYSEFVQTLSEEMDLRIEAKHLQEFGRNFAVNSKVKVPKVHDNLVSKNVLIMEKMDGVKITDLQGLRNQGVDGREIADTLLKSYLKQVVDDGFFHADPHPGNLLVSQGRLVFLDFGMMGRIDPEKKPAFRRGLSGIVRNDPKLLTEVLVELGFVLPHADMSAIEQGVGLLLSQFSGGGFQELSTREAMKLMEEMSQFFLEQPIQMPTNFTFLGRAVGILLGLMESLAPEIDIVDLIGEAAGTGGENTRREGIDFIAQEVSQWAKAALQLPFSVNNMAKSLASGELRAQVDLQSLERGLSKLAHQVSLLTRLVLILGGAALYILYRIMGG